MKVKVAQYVSDFCDPMDFTAMEFSDQNTGVGSHFFFRASFQPRD